MKTGCVGFGAQLCIPMNMCRMEGQLEFYDTSDMTLMNSVEHTQATDLKWDPTGRYVVTSVSAWNQKVRQDGGGILYQTWSVDSN